MVKVPLDSIYLKGYIQDYLIYNKANNLMQLGRVGVFNKL